MKAFILSLTLASIALADSTIDATNRFAYAANGGFENWRWSSSPLEGVVVTENILFGKIYSPNFGWIDLGNGAPDNGHTYENGSGEYGVNNFSGILGGKAYGANIGWVTFDWAPGNDPNVPRIDLATGKFSGFAYSANVGWIKLDASATAFLETDSFRCPDTDNDGIPDWWEELNAGGLNPSGLARYTATSDTDKDGVSDLHEYLAMTDPEDANSFLKITASTYSAGATTYTVTFPTDSGRRYRIETSTLLTAISWGDSGLGTFSPDSSGTTTKVISIPGSATDPKRFFRVQAVVPLKP